MLKCSASITQREPANVPYVLPVPSAVRKVEKPPGYRAVWAELSPLVWTISHRPAPEAAAVIGFVSSVTAPVSAKIRPSTLAPVLTVSLTLARMLPTRMVLVPTVAELPTCQNTFPAIAPLARTTEELLAAVSVLPIWKMYTPLPLSVRVPVNCAESLKQYTPGESMTAPGVVPRIRPLKLVAQGCACRAAYAVCASA